MSDKWWDISDDELDDLFREASDKVDIPFDQSSFDKLNQKINNQSQVKRFEYVKRVKWLLLLLFVFIGAGLVYRAVKTNGVSLETQKNQSSNISISQQAEKNKSFTNNEGKVSLPSIQSAQEKQKLSDAKTVEKPDLASLNKKVPSEKEQSISKATQNESVIVAKTNTTKKTKTFTKVDKNRITTIQSISNTSQNTISIVNLVTQKEQSKQISMLKHKEVKTLAVNLKIELPKTAIPQEEFAKPVVALQKQKFSRFGVRLAFAPDANAVENFSSFALGKSAGILLEYKISKRFIIQAGAIYAAKTYGTSIDNYHAWAKNWSTRPIKPNNVEGTCNMIDLPLNLRFNVFQKPNQTWFVSSGLSSYLMLKETYEYYYDTPTAPTGLPTYLTWKRDNDYYFSTLNLSFGFEKRIGKGLTIQAEPYLKTPLTEVGRGKVNLYSSGLLFSIKHDF
jgi:lipopolysaccharide export system protein LptC